MSAVTDPHRPSLASCPGLIATPILACLLLTPALLSAQSSGGPYTLRRAVVGSGGESAGAPYRLVGTVAEPGAGTSSAPGWHLAGGFHGQIHGGDHIFCDGFENQPCP